MTKYQYNRAAQSCSVDDKIEIIRKAIEYQTKLKMVYLRPNDEKTSRTVIPRMVEDMEYQGKAFLGMRAFCMKRNAERTFRVDRILELKEE